MKVRIVIARLRENLEKTIMEYYQKYEVISVQYTTMTEIDISISTAVRPGTIQSTNPVYTAMVICRTKDWDLISPDINYRFVNSDGGLYESRTMPSVNKGCTGWEIDKDARLVCGLTVGHEIDNWRSSLEEREFPSLIPHGVQYGN